MPIPRKELINLDATPYYHCISRCVQQCFLLGRDKNTGRSYGHRRAWVEARLIKQAEAFAIKVCAYAVMSNHVHVVVKVDKRQALEWSDREVYERWKRVAKTSLLVERYFNEECLTDIEQQAVVETIKQYRKKLYNISHFMGMLNWHIARRANKEEGRKGHFWEGRFYSQALLDEKSLLACMAYVDLNPIRSGVSPSVDKSKYTSIHYRMIRKNERHKPLESFQSNNQSNSIPCDFQNYVALLAQLAQRQQSTDKKRSVSSLSPAQIIGGLSDSQWYELTQRFESFFCYAVGEEAALHHFKWIMGKKRIRGVRHARRLFGSQR